MFKQPKDKKVDLKSCQTSLVTLGPLELTRSLNSESHLKDKKNHRIKLVVNNSIHYQHEIDTSIYKT